MTVISGQRVLFPTCFATSHYWRFYVHKQIHDCFAGDRGVYETQDLIVYLRIYACMCECNVCIHVYKYESMHACLYVGEYESMHAIMHACPWLCMHECMCVCVCACVCVCVCVCVCFLCCELASLPVLDVWSYSASPFLFGRC